MKWEASLTKKNTPPLPCATRRSRCNQKCASCPSTSIARPLCPPPPRSRGPPDRSSPSASHRDHRCPCARGDFPRVFTQNRGKTAEADVLDSSSRKHGQGRGARRRPQREVSWEEPFHAFRAFRRRARRRKRRLWRTFEGARPRSSRRGPRIPQRGPRGPPRLPRRRSGAGWAAGRSLPPPLHPVPSLQSPTRRRRRTSRSGRGEWELDRACTMSFATSR